MPKIKEKKNIANCDEKRRNNIINIEQIKSAWYSIVNELINDDGVNKAVGFNLKNKAEALKTATDSILAIEKTQLEIDSDTPKEIVSIKAEVVSSSTTDKEQRIERIEKELDQVINDKGRA